MLITITKTVVRHRPTGFFVGNPGETHDVADDLAADLIQEDLAVEAAAAEVVEADAGAVEKPKGKPGRKPRAAASADDESPAPVAPPAGEEAPAA